MLAACVLTRRDLPKKGIVPRAWVRMDGASVGFWLQRRNMGRIPYSYRIWEPPDPRYRSASAGLLAGGGGGRAKPFLDPGGFGRLGLGFVPPEAGRNRRPPAGRRATDKRLFFYISAGSPSQEPAASAEDTAYGEHGIRWRRDAQGTRREAKEKAQIKSGLSACRKTSGEWKIAALLGSLAAP